MQKFKKKKSKDTMHRNHIHRAMLDRNDEAWKKKRHDIDAMIGHVKKLDDVNHPNSASSKVLSSLLNEVNKMDVEAMRSYILRCPGLNSDNPAVLTALDAVDAAERMLQSGTNLPQSLDVLSSAPSLDYSCCSPNNSLFSETKEDDFDDSLQINVPENNDQKLSVVKSSKQATMGIILRLIFLDIPLVSICLCLALAYSARHMYTVYYDPIIDSFAWYDNSVRGKTEYTNYNRECDTSDISTANIDDLIIDPNTTTPQEAVEIANKHGLAIFPNVLTEKSMAEMREFVLRRNAELTDDDAIPLISQENRWSFPIGGDDDPSVPPIFREIATNVMLQSSLDLLLGEDPAMVEFTAITAAYGAGDQHWHADTEYHAGAIHYARSFLPMYSFFIPLQDTTGPMGATSACPGTHLCGDEEYLTDACDKLNFQIDDSRGRLATTEDDHVWKAGDVGLMHLNLYHRGASHTDPQGTERVMLIMSITPKQEGPHFDKRAISLGTSYSNRWDMWGLTMKDLVDVEKAMKFHWKMLRFFGIYKPKGSNWGWDYFTVACARILNDQMGFRFEDLEWFTRKVSEKNVLLEHTLGQLPQVKTESGWKEYFNETFERCFRCALIVYGVSSIMYIVTGVALGGGSATISRLFKISGVVGICFFLTLRYVSFTSWGQDVLTGKINDSPFVEIHGSNSLTHELMSEGKTASPIHTDILIPSRCDSKYLAGMNTVLNHQPGNTYLSYLISDFAGDYSNSPTLSVVVDNIISKVNKQGRRFLRQNFNGDWSILSSTQTVSFVQTALLTAKNDILLLLKRELSFLLSECRHGRNRNSAMFRKHSQMNIISLEQSLFSSKDKVIPIKSLANRKFNQRHLFITMKAPTSLKNVKSPDSKETFVIGDHVEAFFGGEGWFHGRIRRNEERIRRKKGTYYTVAYDDGTVEIEHNLRLRPFRGYEQGEHILASQFEGTIHSIKGNGYVTMEGYDGTLHLDIPIRDVRRLL